MSYEVIVLSQSGDVLSLECQWRVVDGFKLYHADGVDQMC